MGAALISSVICMSVHIGRLVFMSDNLGLSTRQLVTEHLELTGEISAQGRNLGAKFTQCFCEHVLLIYCFLRIVEPLQDSKQRSLISVPPLGAGLTLP